MNRICTDCKVEKDISNFYTRKRSKDITYYPYCKKCCTKRSVVRKRQLKIKAIKYKGGECIKCRYNKYYGALEFHHRDPSKKEFDISKKTTSSFSDAIKKELDKCDLLCSNCHKEEHGELQE